MENLPARKVTTAITSKDYSKDYALALLNHFKDNKRATMASFCASLDVSVHKFKSWLEKHKDFEMAWEIAQTKSIAAIEALGFDLAEGDVKGNVTAYKFLATNLHPETFKDKQVTEHQGGMMIMVDTGIKRPGDIGYEDWLNADFVSSESSDDEDLI